MVNSINNINKALGHHAPEIVGSSIAGIFLVAAVAALFFGVMYNNSKLISASFALTGVGIGVGLLVAGVMNHYQKQSQKAPKSITAEQANPVVDFEKASKELYLNAKLVEAWVRLGGEKQEGKTKEAAAHEKIQGETQEAVREIHSKLRQDLKQLILDQLGDCPENLVDQTLAELKSKYPISPG